MTAHTSRAARDAMRAARALLAALAFAVAQAAAAAEPDLGRAERLVSEGRYREAYDLLAPFEPTRGSDPQFGYLFGRAALGTGDAARAKVLFERSLAARPGSIPTRLALGRAYYALGQYAEAKIEFETVLSFDNLPPDLESQVQIYADAAAQYLDRGRRLTWFGYAETGVGRYRVNSTRGTQALGGDDRQDTFYNARAGGGLDYFLSDEWALDASLDYRFRHYDNPDVRNDSDWRWRAAATRVLDAASLVFGTRGRVSYRGDGIHRTDYGLFATWRYRLDEDNQLALGAEVERRHYPNGPLRDRSRTRSTASAGWTRGFADGKATFSLRGWGGYNYATSRPDGDSAVYGATASLDYTFSPRLGGFVFAWYEHDNFNTDRIHFHPDALDESVILRRKDNLYEIGGGLVWEFARNWTLRPEILWIRDQSNAVAFNYSSTEVWLNVRYGF
ncbi:MAG: tetratricopeptide repeat protein [Burkholderiales bacterium]|nr:tetratricopeptide repeat protein [Burkholderiales bacterium]